MTKIFYVDESGEPDPYQIPLLSGHTPLFVLTGLVFDLDYWRAFDREFLKLKSTFFAKEMAQHKGRPEEFEVKGNYLFSPRNKKSQRNSGFIDKVFQLLNRYQARAFSIITIKNPNVPVSKVSVYTASLQYLVERFSIYISEGFPDINGVVIMDSRSKQTDITIIRSHVSFIFGHETGRQFLNVVEAPLFADSRFTAGLQLADIFSGGLYALYYHRNCHHVSGAIDYSHITTYQNDLMSFQFISRNRYDGFLKYGFRVIDHNRP